MLDLMRCISEPLHPLFLCSLLRQATKADRSDRFDVQDLCSHVITVGQLQPRSTCDYNSYV